MNQDQKDELADVMIKDCSVREKRLTDWEVRFVLSVTEHRKRSSLTEKQFKTLEDIWEKATDAG